MPRYKFQDGLWKLQEGENEKRFSDFLPANRYNIVDDERLDRVLRKGKDFVGLSDKLYKEDDIYKLPTVEIHRSQQPKNYDFDRIIEPVRTNFGFDNFDLGSFATEMTLTVLVVLVFTCAYCLIKYFVKRRFEK